MPSDFDFNVRDSELHVGIEIEFPRVGSGEYMKDRGENSNSLQNEARYTSLPGRNDYDGTVGLEIVSDTLPLGDMAPFYADAIETTEEDYGVQYQPTGLMDGGNTAGTHIHLSPLTQEEARDLYDLSQRPWMQVLFCSSIAQEGEQVAWPVFRGGRYCRMDADFNNRYHCVNHRSGSHYEWRMPEPMVKEHAEILARFLALFKQDRELAVQYAQELLDEADDRITSIARAEAVGMDIEAAPSVHREMADDDPEHFFETVREGWSYPEIHTVNANDTEFYVFDSQLDATFEAEGVSFTSDDVLYADSLNSVPEEVAAEVQEQFRAARRTESRETEATEHLKEVMKKKKGKA